MNIETNKRATRPENLAVAKIIPAAWNVHRADEHGESLRGLVDSIRENGMIHRIAVRPVGRNDGGCDYEVIDGHRRLAAAMELGWEEVPCEVHYALDDSAAQEMTVTANVQRMENDPLLEAEVIGKLNETGKTYAQIAAVLGKDEKYVARRARLCNLTKKWRVWLGKNEADADTMEMVARYDRDLQKEAWDALDMNRRGEIDANDIERTFHRLMLEIKKDTPFDTEECKSCPFNTATNGLLFESDEPGRCQKPSCFREKWNAWTDERIGKLRKKQTEVKEVKEHWNIPNSWSTSKRKTKTNTVPYVYMDGPIKKLEWGEPQKKPVKAAMTDEEKAEAKRAKAEKRNRRKAYEKMRCYLSENAETVVGILVNTPGWIRKHKNDLIVQCKEGYAYDETINEIVAFVTLEELDGLGGIDLTEDERKALAAGPDSDGEEE